MQARRMTTRRWMIVVSVVATSMWLGVITSRVRNDPRGQGLYHLWERHGSEEYHSVFNSQHPSPFWPRYWRTMLGRPWPGSYVCDEGCTKTWDRVGRIVVTVPYNPMASTKTTPDGRIDPSDPIAVADSKYNRLVRERERRNE
jgi:hypothetical protein